MNVNEILNLFYPNRGNKTWDQYLEGDYKTTTNLTIVTDFERQIPNCILKFENLESLTINGSRWWDMTMEHVPVSVKTLNFTEQSNLEQEKCLIGMERLVKLEYLGLDAECMGFHFYTDWYKEKQQECTVSLPKIPRLKMVFLQEGIWAEEDRLMDWESIIRESILFKNYKIVDVKREDISNTNIGGIYVKVY